MEFLWFLIILLISVPYAGITIIVIPLLSNLVMYFTRPKFIWAALILIFIFNSIATYFLYPVIFEYILTESYDYDDFADMAISAWLFIFLPLQVISALLFTTVTFGVYIFKLYRQGEFDLKH